MPRGDEAGIVPPPFSPSYGEERMSTRTLSCTGVSAYGEELVRYRVRVWGVVSLV